MSNVFWELEHQKFHLNKLAGLNKKRNAKSRITFVGKFDKFTISTVYEHYEVIASNLKVYPTVTIYDKTRQLDGGFSGFYHSSNHHIDMVDEYYIISMLAHEMRHAFQYTYFPALFYESAYNTAQQYLDCKVERDAREYAIAYCAANGLHEEKNALLEHEQQIELVIKKRLLPSAVGLDSLYFHKNPKIAQSFHQDRGYAYEDEDGGYYYGEMNGSSGRFTRLVKRVLGVGILLFFLGNYFSDHAEEKKGNLSSNLEQYVLENSAVEYLTNEDLNKLSKEQLRLARNEIYARHGFIFGAADLNEYFLSQSWYTPNSAFTESLLSDIEHRNVSVIQQYEK